MNKFFQYTAVFYFLLLKHNGYACDIATNNLPLKTTLAYVVAADRKIYAIDFNDGKLAQTSNPIDGLGRPSDIAINPCDRHLFISSERDLQLKNNVGIVEVLPFKPFTLVKTLLSEPDPEALKRNATTDSQFNTATSVFWLNFSPDGSLLYVGGIIDRDKGINTILNPNTGEKLGWTNFLLTKNNLISPDKKLAVAMWPAATIIRNGKQKHIVAGIAVTDIASGKRISLTHLEGNTGLQPPWGKLTSPFIYLRMSNRHLLTYHRDSGQLISEIDVQQLTQCDPAQTYPTLLENPNHIALAMACSQEEGAVVVIDVIEQRLIHKIKVGPFPTNVVVAKH